MQTYPVVRIDCDALRHNFAQIKSLARHNPVMAVIKADAYGHGAVDVARLLPDSDAFAVARIDEALTLRESGITQPIVVLEGVQNPQALQKAAQQSLSLVFHHRDQVQMLSRTALPAKLPACWLMLETGMHRLGMPEHEAGQALTLLQQSDAVAGTVGVMSHFACADDANNDDNERQWQRTRQFAAQFHCTVSMANSAAMLSRPQDEPQWLRPGLMLYGISPFAQQTADELGIKAVMKLVSQVIAIQSLKSGDKVGYGGDWTAQQDCRIAIVDIGYGDGYSRQLSNKGSVLIQGDCVPVVGRVSMDMIAVDVTAIAHVALGDEVILWGDQRLPVEQVAQWADTIAYELVCQVNGRVRREYING